MMRYLEITLLILLVLIFLASLCVILGLCHLTVPGYLRYSLACFNAPFVGLR